MVFLNMNFISVSSTRPFYLRECEEKLSNHLEAQVNQLIMVSNLRCRCSREWIRSG